MAVIIKKIPFGRKDLENYLKHKRKEMNSEDLIVDFESKKIIEDQKGNGHTRLRLTLWNIVKIPN